MNDLLKENSLITGFKQINFSEKDFELVQNLDDSLLTASHIPIKFTEENKSNLSLFSNFNLNDYLFILKYRF